MLRCSRTLGEIVGALLTVFFSVVYFHCDDTREYHSLSNSLTSGQGITLDLRSTTLYSIRKRYVAASVILTAIENIREFALVMKEGLCRSISLCRFLLALRNEARIYGYVYITYHINFKAYRSPGDRDMGNLGMRADKSSQVRRMRADRRRALWLRMLDNPGFLNSTRKMRSQRVASLHKEFIGKHRANAKWSTYQSKVVI
jgi:hypothetical protein